jgi:hypothetical protein
MLSISKSLTSGEICRYAGDLQRTPVDPGRFPGTALLNSAADVSCYAQRG